MINRGGDWMVLLDDVHISNLNMYTPEERPSVPTPLQDVEYIDIKGRNGSLTKKHGYKDIPFPLIFQIYNTQSFKAAFRSAKQAIIQSSKLAFEDDPNIFYKIKSAVIDSAENEVKEFGQFTVNFILDPFQYVNTSTVTVTSQKVINNPGYVSEPYIKCYVNGTGRIYIDDQVITISDVNGTIEMDSTMMNAYKVENGYITNLNNHMIGDFLLFKPGNNLVKFDGAITKLEIVPRWRWI